METEIDIERDVQMDTHIGRQIQDRSRIASY